MATFKEIGKNKVEIEFEITREAFEAESVKAYQKNKGKYQVPGFRKGKAPKSMLEKYYGEGIFFEDAFNNSFPDAYDAAIQELGLDIVSRPENVDILSMEAGEPIKVKAEAYIRPEVELGNYESFNVEFEDVPLAEDAVEKEIEKDLNDNARLESADRPAQIHDTVILDYSGSVNGVKFDGGTAEGQQLELGSNTFIPGFEEQLLDMKAGEEKDIEVTFPEQYHEKSLAGKPAVFHVKISDVKQKIVPEANDEFAEDNGFDNFEEYRADVEKRLQKQNEDQNNIRFEAAMIDTIVDASNVDIPDAMVELQLDREVENMSYELAYQGIDMDSYFKYTGSTMESVRANLKPMAARKVKTNLVLDAIIKKENVEPEEEDMLTAIKGATGKDQTLEEVEKAYGQEGLEYVKGSAPTYAVIRFLKGRAVKVAPEKKEEPAAESAEKTEE